MGQVERYVKSVVCAVAPQQAVPVDIAQSGVRGLVFAQVRLAHEAESFEQSDRGDILDIDFCSELARAFFKQVLR